MNTENKKHLVSIPVEYTKTIIQQMSCALNWLFVIFEESIFASKKNNIKCSYFEFYKSFWKMYFLFKENCSNKKENIELFIYFGFNIIWISIYFLLISVYKYTIKYITNIFNKNQNEFNLLSMLTYSYIEYVKENKWYEFDFLLRLVAYFKHIKNQKISFNPYIIEENISFILKFFIKGIIANIIMSWKKLIFKQNNTEAEEEEEENLTLGLMLNTDKTLIEIKYFPVEFQDNYYIEEIGDYKNNKLILLPKGFGLVNQLKRVKNRKNNIIYNIAGHSDYTYVACIGKNQQEIKLKKFFEIQYLEKEKIIIYKIKIENLLLFMKFCEMNNINLYYIFDF